MVGRRLLSQYAIGMSLLLPGCQRALSHAERLALARGCYRLRFEHSLGGSFVGFAPSHFKLDTIPRALADTLGQPRPLQRLRVEPMNPRFTYGIGLPWWELRDADSLQIVWSSGLGGIALHLQVRHDSLIGTAQGSTDLAGVPEPTTQAWAIRMPCPDSSLTWEDLP
jgi:hypothetical protein